MHLVCYQNREQSWKHLVTWHSTGHLFELSGSFQILLALEEIGYHHFSHYLWFLAVQEAAHSTSCAAVTLVALKKVAAILCCKSRVTNEVKGTLRLM